MSLVLGRSALRSSYAIGRPSTSQCIIVHFTELATKISPELKIFFYFLPGSADVLNGPRPAQYTLPSPCGYCELNEHLVWAIFVSAPRDAAIGGASQDDPRSPAIVAGLTNHVWELGIRRLIVAPEELGCNSPSRPLSSPRAIRTAHRGSAAGPAGP